MNISPHAVFAVPGHLVRRLGPLALLLLVLLPGFCCFSGAAQAQQGGASQPGAGASPLGRWITPGANRAIIQIEPCGPNLCGRIVGIVLAHLNDPMPLDWKGRPQCGLTILETRPTTNASGVTIWHGSVLDPRDGFVYNAKLAVDDSRHLRMSGYFGLPIFGETQIWTPFNGRILAGCRLAVQPPPSNG